MADKQITDLQLRDNVTDEVNFPGDDGIQTYRMTALQLLQYILAAGNVGATQLATDAVESGKIKDANVTLQKLATTVQAALVPVASVLSFAGSSAPTGYLLCNGAAVSRSTYADLFAAIGITHGQGDGSTTFNLPDYRGRFMRGVSGSGITRDPDKAGRTAMATGGNTGDNVGSLQDEAFKSHSHGFGFMAGTVSGNNWPNTTTILAGNPSSGGGFIWNNGPATGVNTSEITNTGGNETRPINAYVHFIIKT